MPNMNAGRFTPRNHRLPAIRLFNAIAQKWEDEYLYDFVKYSTHAYNRHPALPEDMPDDAFDRMMLDDLVLVRCSKVAKIICDSPYNPERIDGNYLAWNLHMCWMQLLGEMCYPTALRFADASANPKGNPAESKSAMQARKLHDIVSTVFFGGDRYNDHQPLEKSLKN